MKRFKSNYIELPEPEGENLVIQTWSPGQIKLVLRAYTDMMVENAMQAPPSVGIEGEADRIHFSLIERVATKASDQISYGSDGTADVENFEVGSVVLAFLDAGTTANAAVEYLQNLKTKPEMDVLTQVSAAINQGLISPDDAHAYPKDQMYKTTMEMITDSSTLYKWLDGHPAITSPTDPDLPAVLITSIIQHSGKGAIKKIGIKGYPQQVAKRTSILTLCRTLMNHDRTWLDGFSLFLAFQAYSFMTKDAITYDNFFPRVTASTSATQAANLARSAEKTGYHLITLAYSGVTLFNYLNHALFQSEVTLAQRFISITTSESNLLKDVLSDFDKHQASFNFNVVKSIFEKVMAAVRKLTGSDVVVGDKFNALLGSAIPPETKYLDRYEVPKFLASSAARRKTEVTAKPAVVVALLAEKIRRLNANVQITNEALQHSALLGTSLEANAFQLPEGAIFQPESDTFQLEHIFGEIDLENLSKYKDSFDSSISIPSTIAPFEWTFTDEGEPKSMKTFLDDHDFAFINESTMKQEILAKILSPRILWKWNHVQVPIDGLAVANFSKTNVPFNYTRRYEIKRLDRREMREQLPVPGSLSDGASDDAIDLFYSIIDGSDVLTQRAVADSLLSIGLLFKAIRNEKMDIVELIVPTVSFAYGVHLSVYLAKMGLTASMKRADFFTVIKERNFKIFRDNSEDMSPMWLLDPEMRYHQSSFLVEFSHLPAEKDVVYVPAIIGHTGYIPVPVIATHFSGSTSAEGDPVEESDRFSTEWLLQEFSKLNVNSVKHLSLKYGRSVLESIEWEPHYGYSVHQLSLPHVAFRIQGGRRVDALLSSIDMSNIFTSHRLISNLPFRKFVVSKRDRSIIMIETQDIRNLKESVVKTAATSTSSVSSIDTKDEVNSPTAEDLIENISGQNDVDGSGIIVDADNASGLTKTPEIIEEAINEIGTPSNVIIPPTTKKKGNKKDPHDKDKDKDKKDGSDNLSDGKLLPPVDSDEDDSRIASDADVEDFNNSSTKKRKKGDANGK